VTIEVIRQHSGIATRQQRLPGGAGLGVRILFHPPLGTSVQCVQGSLLTLG
jgi:hypothetical protein